MFKQKIQNYGGKSKTKSEIESSKKSWMEKMSNIVIQMYNEQMFGPVFVPFY